MNNLVLPGHHTQVLSLESSHSFLDSELYKDISSQGFEGVEWEQIPDEFLMYIYLHKNNTLRKQRSERTKRKYLETLVPFLTYVQAFGGLREISAQRIYAYQLYLEREKGYKASTLARHSTVIKQFLRFLVQEDMIETNLTTKMAPVAQPREELVDRDLHEHEVQQLLSYFKQKDLFAYTLLVVLTSTGMRIEELAKAKWRDLEWRSPEGAFFLHIMGKGEKERPIFLFADVLRILQDFRREREMITETFTGDSAFFPKKNGGHYHVNYLGDRFSKLMASAPFPFVQHRRDPITPHTCRHYTTYYMLEHGADLASVRDMLGHASIRTTERYLLRRRNYGEHAGLKVNNSNFIT
ncbi:tyrosine-type recombinase/integrase [Marinococcus halophilus]|uniref:tyrosine-type recombinase/integrase n=1 Tax=Marinococcus halophilus TaxID=1371 RepID=UPI0009A8AAE3|nr:tyrosine-type recombinase/integrase [Marinococcus halophilus]